MAQAIPSPEAIRQVTLEIVSRPEFAGPGSWETTIAALLKALGEWLRGLGEWSAASPRLALVVGIVLGLLSLACLAHLLYMALGGILPLRKKKTSASDPRFRWSVLEGKADDWREALQTARALLGEGDLRRAIWITHRVLLGRLSEQGAIRFAGWKTNTHYLRECADGHPWYDTFAELSELYEQAIYGGRAASPARAESLVLAVDRLCNERAA